MEKNNLPNKKKWGDIQVQREHYFTKEYLDKARFLGLQAQIETVLRSDPENKILEIGPGPGLFSAFLNFLGYEVTTIDFDHTLKPDVAGRLPELPFKRKAFDLVCAFEILEHIPFELFRHCLMEIKRITKKEIVISVPDQRKLHRGEFSFTINLFNRRYKKILYRKKLNNLGNPDEHYWEIGHNGISPNEIIYIAKELNLEPVSNIFKGPWFRFFEFRIP